MFRKLQNVLIFAGLLLLLVILNLSIPKQASQSSGYPAPVATIDPIGQRYLDSISSFQTELAQPDLPEEARTLIAAKLEGESMAATQRVEGMTSAPTRPAVLPATPTFVGTSFKFPDGIDPNPPYIPIPVAQALVEVLTSWRKTTGDRPYLIYSGCLKNDPQQGIIMVPQLQSPLFHQYYTPERTGGVSVIAENGLVITLQAESGALYYFDVAQEWFVDANGSLLPTYTPSPTPIPTSTPTITPGPMYPAP